MATNTRNGDVPHLGTHLVHQEKARNAVKVSSFFQ